MLFGACVTALFSKHWQILVWVLNVHNRFGKIRCLNDNGEVIRQQAIPFTDFPMPELMLYFIIDMKGMTIMLPREYQ